MIPQKTEMCSIEVPAF